MDFVPWIVFGIGVVIMVGYHLILFVLIKHSQKKLNALGELVGTSFDVIKSQIGAPDSKMSIDNGEFCQWCKYGYHLCLSFDEANTCIKVDYLQKNER